MNNELKILCVGNSFSDDTTSLLPEIALHAGFRNVKIANLYAGGSSINMHCERARQDLPAYLYNVYESGERTSTKEYKISDAIKSDDWDWISIQHGTKDKSRYTELSSYKKLPWLIEYIKGLAPARTKIAFNMTWIGEPNHHHEEIQFYGGDQLLIYEKTAKLTQEHILTLPGIDAISPTGTAIQNARTGKIGLLTRDGYHLNQELGRPIAGMTFLKALTGVEIASCPQITSEDARAEKVALEAVNNAIANPFRVTPSKL